MTVEATIRNTEQARDRGDNHRALEILRSSHGNYGYSEALLKAYGDALFSNGNLLQAGGFYLVSYRSLDSAESDCISRFIEKHAGCPFPEVIILLPKPARFEELSMYPDYVQERLRLLGAEEVLAPKRAPKSDRWLLVGCVACGLAILTLTLIGILTVIKWILI